MQFRLQAVPEWPQLAWVARLVPGEHEIRVWHGRRVEARGPALFEAVWAGDLVDADFDRTDLVFGSGIRLRDGSATFVSSGTVVDRLQSAETASATWVSNSLACLLRHVDGAVDPTDPGYYAFFGSVCDGLDTYRRELATSAGPVRLTYFNNLRWDGQSLTAVEKPHSVDGFRSFDDYRGFLRETVREIAANLADPRRRFPYEMLGTLSSGYDSSAVATLGAEAGMTEAITFHHVHAGRADCGHDVAKALGVRLDVIDRDAWRAADDLPEVPFISVDNKGSDVFFRGARDHLAGKVLMTGYHGDKVWDMHPKCIGANIVRGDRSGLSLSEFRLSAGFINWAVPFMGVRHHADLCAISNSDEMKAWDVGGDYTRPICRRIVEEAGVARDAFGCAKAATGILFRNARSALSDSGTADFHAWLRQHANAFVRRGQVPPHLAQAALAPVEWAARRGGWALYNRTGWLPRPLASIRSVSRRVARFGEREHLTKHMFPWAIDRAKRQYVQPSALPDADVAPTLTRVLKDQVAA